MTVVNRISSGSGNDTIIAYGNNMTIDAGSGNDKITYSGDNGTVIGGAGSDTIKWWGSENVIRGDQLDGEEHTDDGNDIIITDISLIDSRDGYDTTRTEYQKTKNDWHYYDGEVVEYTGTAGKDRRRHTYSVQYKIWAEYGQDVTYAKPKGNNDVASQGGNDTIKQDSIISKGAEYWHNNIGTAQEVSRKEIKNEYLDPLVLDTDKDGSVEASAGMGVDLDGDGIGDVAATGGDKMLSLGDVNNDGNIDGAEVFGDQTLSPFTGKPLNASNGFEALRMIAEEAQTITGIKCFRGGNVDLRALKQALETAGVSSLGLISGINTTVIDDLGDIASVNVDGYSNTSDATHRQQGYYTDANGNTYGADDIWVEGSAGMPEEDKRKIIEINRKSNPFQN